MNLPTSVVIAGIDSMQILDQAFEAARTFKPMSKAEVAGLLSRTAKFASAGEFELFKTSNRFDGTQQNPQWLNEIRQLLTKHKADRFGSHISRYNCCEKFCMIR